MATGTNIGSTNTFTLNANTSNGVSSFVISETSYTYMRAKTITFKAQGLKPNTKYYAFFAGVYVGAYCSTVDGEVSSDLVTNAVGDLTGNFYMPGGTFICGTHTFELVDNVLKNGSAWRPDPLYGSLTAQYEAFGSLRNQQTQATQGSQLGSVSNNQLTVANTIATTNVNNSVNITNTTTNNVSVTATQPVAPIVPPPPIVCEEWFFDYSATDPGARTSANRQLTTLTIGPTPNPNPWAADPNYANVVYVSTNVLPSGLFEHVYNATITTVGPSTNTGRMRQTWQGPSTTATPTGQAAGSGLPSLTAFRPAGLSATATVSIVQQWTRNGTVACPATFGLRTPTRVDPIAQSFFVDPAKHPDGMFITSIELFFKTVDQSSPVTLELRNMSNGLPGPMVLPHGTIVVPGYTTKQSNDATASTRFVFDTPVFVAPGEDYCFVVKSSSLGYNLWCSRMGEKDVSTGLVIDTQPFGGTLFKSENDSTWIPDSYEDVKFVMRHAQFNTTSTANMIFRPQKTADNLNYAGLYHNLPISFISTVRGSNVVTIKCPLHGLIAGDRIMISGLAEPIPATAYNGIPYTNLNGTHIVDPIDSDEFTITVASSAIKTGSIQARDRFGNLDTTLAQSPVTPTLIAADPVINVGTLTPSTLTGSLPVPPTPIPPGITSTTSFVLHTNMLVNEINVDYMNTTFDTSSIVEKVRLARGYTDISDTGVYTLNNYKSTNTQGDFTLFDSPQLIATPTNEFYKATSLSNQPSAVVDVRMGTTSKDVSPVIDTTGMSLVVRSYKIDNQLDEIDDLRTAVAAGIANQAGAYSGNGIALWLDVASTTITEGLVILNGGRFYEASNSGALGSVAPTHTSGSFVSGIVSLQYLETNDGISRYYKAAYNDDSVGANSEINPGTGHALAKYKSSINTLNDFYDKITVFVSANVPKIDNDSATEIDVYVRFSTDEYTHQDRDWIYCPIDGDYTKRLTPSKTRMNIDEFMFEVNADQLFNIFDVKIVMRTTNSSFVPKIYGIRTIANKNLV